MFSLLLILILDMEPLLSAFQYNYIVSETAIALSNSESKLENKLRTSLVLTMTVKKTLLIFEVFLMH